MKFLNKNIFTFLVLVVVLFTACKDDTLDSNELNAIDDSEIIEPYGMTRSELLKEGVEIAKPGESLAPLPDVDWSNGEKATVVDMEKERKELEAKVKAGKAARFPVINTGSKIIYAIAYDGRFNRKQHRIEGISRVLSRVDLNVNSMVIRPNTLVEVKQFPSGRLLYRFDRRGKGSFAASFNRNGRRLLISFNIGGDFKRRFCGQFYRDDNYGGTALPVWGGGNYSVRKIQGEPNSDFRNAFDNKLSSFRGASHSAAGHTMITDDKRLSTQIGAFYCRTAVPKIGTVNNRSGTIYTMWR